MKNMIVGIVALCAGIVLAEGTNAPSASVKKKRMSPAEFVAYRAAKIASEGGEIAAPIKGKVVRIVVDTDKVTIADAEEVAKSINKLMKVAVEVSGGVNASNERTGCVIMLKEANNSPTLLIAPEDPWATVNVKNLMADNPSAAVLKSRVRKEIWRAFAFAMGAANSRMKPCLMRPIFSLADLDADPVEIVCPEPLPGISQTLGRLNIANTRITTYRKACSEGWAPQPTNDVQKAIWNQVHELPTDPIKIKYDPKRDKE